MPSADASAEALAFQARIHQEFTPNTDAELDLVYTDVRGDISEEERAREEAAKAAEAKAKAEAEAKVAEKEAPAGAPRYTGGGAPADWMAAAGIPESDWGAVDYIVTRESGWNPNALNPSGGYCGLLQIAPLHGVANCHDPVVNLQWGTTYANNRYGSWQAAYQHWATYQNGW